MVYIVNTMTLAVLFQVNGRAKIDKAELIGLINRRRLLVQMMINIEIACAIYSQTLVQAVVVTSAETAPEDVAITEMTEISFSQVFETATGGMWTQMQIIMY